MSEPNPFDPLVPLLVEAIPQVIASLKIAKPLCCVRISYYDTHAPSTYLSLRTVSEECRAGVLASKGRSAPFYLWSSGEECGDAVVDLPSDPPARQHKQIADLFQQVYDLLSEDEDENMVPFREMLQQVARQLNAIAWMSFCLVTDDFVVATADGSQFFADDYADLVHSIPPDRLALLRSRGLLGPEEQWERLS